MSLRTLFETYNKKVKTAQCSEAVNESFLIALKNVMSNLIIHAELRDKVMHAQSVWKQNSPWNSIYKLDGVVVRANKSGSDLSRDTVVSRMKLMLDKVEHLLQASLLKPEDITFKQITGKGMHGGKGLLHTIL